MTTAKADSAVLADNSASLLARSARLAKRFSGAQRIAEHGFSALVELPEDDERILWDAGARSPAFVENMRRIGIDLRSIDSIALSYGYGNHVGGMSRLFREVSHRPTPREFSAGTPEERLVESATSAHPAIHPSDHVRRAMDVLCRGMLGRGLRPSRELRESRATEHLANSPGFEVPARRRER